MPRTARALVDGGTYHVITRGNNGQTLFYHDADCQRYLQLLSTYARQYDLKVYHYVLMANHVHLILEIGPAESLSRAMLALNLSYALFYRRRYQYHGHLWQGRFRSFLINSQTSLLKYGLYLEIHPVRAKLVQDPKNYPWSSYRAYAEGDDNLVLAPHPLYEVLGATPSERQQQYRECTCKALGSRQSAISDTQSSLSGVVSFARRRGRPRKVAVAADEK